MVFEPWPLPSGEGGLAKDVISTFVVTYGLLNLFLG